MAKSTQTVALAPDLMEGTDNGSHIIQIQIMHAHAESDVSYVIEMLSNWADTLLVRNFAPADLGGPWETARAKCNLALV
jgi:hypothetical protein